MIAVAMIAVPLAAYIWLLLRAADDDRTGWDNPTFAPRHAQPPYSWGDDEAAYPWLIAAGWAETLDEIEQLPTVEEPAR